MDFLVLQLGLVKVQDSTSSHTSNKTTSVRRRRAVRARRQLVDSGDSNRTAQYWRDEVIDELSHHLCGDPRVAMRDECPDPALPLQVASASVRSPVVVAVLYYYGGMNASDEAYDDQVPEEVDKEEQGDSDVHAALCTIRYPIVFEGWNGERPSRELLVKVQARLDRAMSSENSTLSKNVLEATGYRLTPVTNRSVEEWAFSNAEVNSTNSSSTTEDDGEDTPTPAPGTYDPRSLNLLRIVGIFVLVLTIDAYAILLWMARRRRLDKNAAIEAATAVANEAAAVTAAPQDPKTGERAGLLASALRSPDLKDPALSHPSSVEAGNNTADRPLGSGGTTASLSPPTAQQPSPTGTASDSSSSSSSSSSAPKSCNPKEPFVPTPTQIPPQKTEAGASVRPLRNRNAQVTKADRISVPAPSSSRRLDPDGALLSQHSSLLQDRGGQDLQPQPGEVPPSHQPLQHPPPSSHQESGPRDTSESSHNDGSSSSSSRETSSRPSLWFT
jgi:hypothetical protein